MCLLATFTLLMTTTDLGQFRIKILCLENTLGIAVDQVYKNHRIPLTKYYFWPRHDAWSLIQDELTSKSWISNEDKTILLNSITEFLNTWQRHVNKKILCNNAYQQKELDFVGIA